ncbi:hypothetical protein [Candidatus Enterovibrio escicola]|nr:hypothetical protein [Candidatus Enterovibrio escacola]
MIRNVTNKGTITAIASSGSAVEEINGRSLVEKKLVCCFDNDEPIKKEPCKGYRADTEGVRLVLDVCSAPNTPCSLLNKELQTW